MLDVWFKHEKSVIVIKAWGIACVSRISVGLSATACMQCFARVDEMCVLILAPEVCYVRGAPPSGRKKI